LSSERKIKIILIAAMCENGVIGKDGKMPWNLPEELAHFKRTTLGNPVLMGRKTFEAIGKILHGRINLVLSRKMKKIERNLFFFDSLDEAFNFAVKNNHERIFVAGGESVFRQTIGVADELILSVVRGNYDGDTFFPTSEIENFTLIAEEEFNEFTVRRYARK